MTISEKELNELKSQITDKTNHLFNGVLYGEFGTRKTTTALRTSRKRAILIHADRGWQVINNHSEFDDKVIPIKYEGLSQILAIIKAVEANEAPFDNVDLIVADTVSQMQEEYIDFLLINAQYSGNQREKASAKPGTKFETTELPGMFDYHLARNKLRPIVRALVNANVNVIFLAHVREPGPMDKTIEKRPNVTEALYKEIARDATFIGLMKKDSKIGFVADFESKPIQSAKSQILTIADKKILVDELPELLWAWADQTN